MLLLVLRALPGWSGDGWRVYVRESDTRLAGMALDPAGRICHPSLLSSLPGQVGNRAYAHGGGSQALRRGGKPSRANGGGASFRHDGERQVGCRNPGLTISYFG